MNYSVFTVDEILVSERNVASPLWNKLSWLQVNGSLVLSHYAKRYGREAAMFDIKNIKNATLYRLMSPIADIGTYALKDEAKLKRVSFSERERESVCLCVCVLCESDRSIYMIQKGGKTIWSNF